MTKYLIDSNALIESSHNYYRPLCFSKVWDEIAKNSNVCMIKQVYDELTGSNDFVSDFVKSNFKDRIVEVDENTVIRYADIQNWLVKSKFWTQAGYTLWSENEKADPWLIAMAKANNYVVVSHERKKPMMSIVRPSSREPKITTVAEHFDVKVITIYQMLDELNFKEA